MNDCECPSFDFDLLRRSRYTDCEVIAHSGDTVSGNGYLLRHRLFRGHLHRGDRDDVRRTRWPPGARAATRRRCQHQQPAPGPVHFHRRFTIRAVRGGYSCCGNGTFVASCINTKTSHCCVTPGAYLTHVCSLDRACCAETSGIPFPFCCPTHTSCCTPQPDAATSAAAAVPPPRTTLDFTPGSTCCDSRSEQCCSGFFATCCKLDETCCLDSNSFNSCCTSSQVCLNETYLKVFPPR